MAIYLALLAIGLPWCGAIFVWILGSRRGVNPHLLASLFGVLGGLVAIGLLFTSTDEVILDLPMGAVFGQFTLIPDGLGCYLAVIAAVIGCLAVIFSADYMKGDAQLGRYYALVLLFIGAMIGLVLSGSLLFMFVFWEITAFCSYALISYHNDDPVAVAAGVKALIMTQLGGIGLLIGALVCYAYLGSYQINVFLQNSGALPSGTLTLVAFGFLAAAAAKSAQVPFQTWLPDAMEAPTPVSALIHAATMVNAGVYLLARFYPAFAPVPGWRLAVVVVGALSALLAAIMAICTDDLKRALAYSTVSQLGYMVYAIGCGAVLASQFHLMSHAVFKALLFLGAGAVIHAVGTRDMRQMGNLGAQMPFTRAVFVIGALGLTGIPLANGFFSKELILEEGFLHGQPWAYGLMVFVAGLTAVYGLRIVALVFSGRRHDRAVSAPGNVHDAPAAMRISLAILALGTMTTWLLVGPFSQLLSETLPFHDIEAETTIEVVSQIIVAPTTWLALCIVAFGFAAWLFRTRLNRLVDALRPVARLAQRGFGFDRLNLQIIHWVRNTALSLSKAQTGQLNWNLAAILAGLLVVLIVVAWGVRG